MQRVLFVGLPGITVGRRFVETAWQMGLTVEVAAPQLPPGWGNPPADWAYPPFTMYHVDLYDEEAALAQLVSLHQAVRWDGAVTYSEAHVPLLARFAERVGLPAVSVAAAAISRNKWLLSQRLSEHDVAVPTTRFARTLRELPDVIREIPFPVVVKPANGMGSAGVLKLSSEQELAVNMPYLEAPPSEKFKPEGYVVQAYIAGDEVSVEGVVQQAQAHILTVTDKRLGAPPFFVEAGHTVPSALPQPVQQEIRSAVIRTVAALGLNDCGFHAEFKVTPAGPVLLEIAARLGGDYIPNIAHLATGVNLFEQVLRVSVGQPVDLQPKRQRGAAVQFIMAPGPGRITAVAGVDAARDVPGVLHLQVDAPTGQVVSANASNYTSRFGLVLVTGRDSPEATGRALAAAGHVRLTTEPEIRGEAI